MKLITPSALVERLKINASLARAACKLLAEVTLMMCDDRIYVIMIVIIMMINNLFHS